MEILAGGRHAELFTDVNIDEFPRIDIHVARLGEAE